MRQPTGLEALLGVLDNDVEVDPLKVITGGQSQAKNEKFNLALMHDSKEKATKVAFEKLGYKVGQKPVGAVISDIDPKVPAFKVLTPGDTVIEADGKPVHAANELVALLRTHRPGDKVRMKIRTTDRLGDPLGPGADDQATRRSELGVPRRLARDALRLPVPREGDGELR